MAGVVPTFTRYDGTGRPPRAVQKQAIEWLTSIWHESPVKAIVGPPATGKSMLARTIQRATGGIIITPSNILIDQYHDTYPTTNFVKGKVHYTCPASNMSCFEWTTVLEQRACHNCVYTACKKAAAEGEPTIFNPMSLAYFVKARPTRWPCVVIDEAHLLPGMLVNLVARRLKRSDYPFTPDVTNERELHRWLVTQSARCLKLSDQYRARDNNKEAGKAREDADAFAILAEAVQREPHNVAVWIDEEVYGRRREQFLNIKPVIPPRFIIDSICNTDHLILMSGTLFPHDVAAIAGGDRVEWLDLPSPIPLANRPVLYRPTDFKMNAQTDPKQIVEAIEKIIAQYPGLNTIIHVSYSLSKKLEPLFKTKVLSNTPETKDKVLAKFKAEGGVFLASGCAEGIDLKDDLCRLNIIPKLLFPDLTDPAVRKRKAMRDGDTWYDLETLKTTIQQVGRSTRHEKDHSVSIVMDPNFSRLALQHKKLLPASFYEAVNWRGK